MRRQRPAAFTIIELLVVISIIALLISILLPSLGAARDRARYVKWQGHAHGLRSDSRMGVYYNLEQQDGTETNKNDEPILRNQAAGDPMFVAKEAVEPEDGNAVLTAGASVLPQWETNWEQGTRFRGKAALDLFDGAHGRSENGDPLVMNSPEITVFAWVRSDFEGGRDYGIFTTSDPTTNDDIINIRYDSSGADSGCSDCMKMSIRIDEDAPQDSASQRRETPSDLQSDQWQFVAMTWRTGTDIRFFFNGKERTMTSLAGLSQPKGSTKVRGGVDNGSIIIGKGGKDNAANLGWLGLIDEVGLARRVFSAEDIEAMYRAGRARARE